MALTHKERLTPRKPQPELSVERIKSAHPTPFPSPGVYAQHNAVDTPALLPDGSRVRGLGARRATTAGHGPLHRARGGASDAGRDREAVTRA